MLLNNKRILLTGASSGIGEETVKELAKAGAIPILVARREKELIRVQNIIQEMTHHSIKSEYISADISVEKDRKKIRDYFLDKNVKLDIIINNAGITSHGLFEESQPEVLRKTMEINFFAAVELTGLLLPILKQSSGKKSIILVSTPSGLYGIPKRFAYSASKAAGHAWLEALRMEARAWPNHTLTTSIFCPGYTRTNLRNSGLSADGSKLSEEQEKNAHNATKVAQKLLWTIRKEKRLVTMDLNGFFVYWLRTLFPSALEWLIWKKMT